MKQVEPKLNSSLLEAMMSASEHMEHIIKTDWETEKSLELPYETFRYIWLLGYMSKT